MSSRNTKDNPMGAFDMSNRRAGYANTVRKRMPTTTDKAIDVAKEHGVSALARAGYFARGVVYFIIGWLAVLATIGRARPTGTFGALDYVFDKPAGWILVGVLAAGLFAHAAWRFVQAAFDLDPPRGNPAAWRCYFVRVGRFVSGLLYFSVAFAAAGLALGWEVRADDGGASTRDWTAWLLTKPFGRAALAIVGGIIIGAGISGIVRVFRPRTFRWVGTDGQAIKWAGPISRFGLGARGIVFCVIGSFVALAALKSDPSKAGGLADALRELRTQPFGQILLLTAGLGLISYAVYSFAEVRWRRVDL